MISVCIRLAFQQEGREGRELGKGRAGREERRGLGFVVCKEIMIAAFSLSPFPFSLFPFPFFLFPFSFFFFNNKKYDIGAVILLVRLVLRYSWPRCNM